MNNQTEIFELVPCDITSVVVENNRDYVVGIEAEDEEYGLSLASYEGALLTFVDSGCADHAHINILHQILLKFKKSAGFFLDRVIIEAKYGDVFYCRLHWGSDSGKDIYNICSLGDALILYRLALCDLYIARSVLIQLEKFDSDGFVEVYED